MAIVVLTEDQKLIVDLTESMYGAAWRFAAELGVSIETPDPTYKNAHGVLPYEDEKDVNRQRPGGGTLYVNSHGEITGFLSTWKPVATEENDSHSRYYGNGHMLPIAHVNVKINTR
jgi:hypothetical protein